jgi:hypothetical protein
MVLVQNMVAAVVDTSRYTFLSWRDQQHSHMIVVKVAVVVRRVLTVSTVVGLM